MLWQKISLFEYFDFLLKKVITKYIFQRKKIYLSKLVFQRLKKINCITI